MILSDLTGRRKDEWQLERVMLLLGMHGTSALMTTESVQPYIT